MKTITRHRSAALLGCALGLFLSAAAVAQDTAALTDYFNSRAEDQAKTLKTPALQKKLSAEQAAAFEKTIWDGFAKSQLAADLEKQLKAGLITTDKDKMPVHVELFWPKDKPMPENGYPLFVSMHGGGAGAKEMNDGQWRNQYKLYPHVQGLYICPRAPRDTWDHWHNQFVHPLMMNLVTAAELRGDIDSNRIYFMGYSSGGNGVYQLAPLFADRLGAASASAGMTEGAPPENLRNLPIDIQWGQRDDAYKRSQSNRDYVNKLYALRKADPTGYPFREVEHWRMGHGVNDKNTVEWMPRFTRNPQPDKVVWVQGGKTRQSSNPQREAFYWLAMPEDHTISWEVQQRMTASIDRAQNTIEIDASGVDRLRVLLNDQMLDLDKPVIIKANGKTVHRGLVKRSKAVQLQTFEMRRDRGHIYSASVTVDIPAAN